MEERAELERREIVMVRRLELMKWLNTCPDRNWEIVHEDEGHACPVYFR